MCLFASGFTQARRSPFHPAPSRPSFPQASRQYRYQQQQNNRVNTNNNNNNNNNNVNPYYDGYQDEDWATENDNPFPSNQNENDQMGEHNRYGNARPSAPHRGNEQGFTPATAPWQSRVQTPPVKEDSEPEPECGIRQKYKNSVPRGRLDEIQVTHLESDTAVGCIKKCCALGPRRCSFIWVYASKCMAVACPPEAPELCEPKQIDGAGLGETGYYRVLHPFEHNMKSEFENGKWRRNEGLREGKVRETQEERNGKGRGENRG